MPDQAANHGHWQSLADTSILPLTCARTGPAMAAHVLLSSRSRLLGVLKEDPFLKTASLITLAGGQRLEFLPRHGQRAQQSLEYLPYVSQLVGKLVS